MIFAAGRNHSWPVHLPSHGANGLPRWPPPARFEPYRSTDRMPRLRQRQFHRSSVLVKFNIIITRFWVASLANSLRMSTALCRTRAVGSQESDTSWPASLHISPGSPAWLWAGPHDVSENHEGLVRCDQANDRAQGAAQQQEEQWALQEERWAQQEAECLRHQVLQDAAPRYGNVDVSRFLSELVNPGRKQYAFDAKMATTVHPRQEQTLQLQHSSLRNLSQLSGERQTFRRGNGASNRRGGLA